MRLELTFDVPRDGLTPTEISRLLADIQHQIVAFGLLATIEMGGYDEPPGVHWPFFRLLPMQLIDDPVLGVYENYRLMVSEMRPHHLQQLGLDVSVARISQSSPLKIVTVVKASAKKMARMVRFGKLLYEKFYFYDVERERRSAEAASIREDVIRKRIENIDRLYELNQKIDDPEIREGVRRHLAASILPFDNAIPKTQYDDRFTLTGAKVSDGDDHKRGI